jgi:hypothetical protein
MSRVKLGLLSLVAVFAVNAMAAVSASALSNAYFEQPSKALGTEAIEGVVGSASLQSEVSGLKIIIECTKNSFTGEIEAGGKSKGEIKYESCKVLSVKEGKKETLTLCKVLEPISFKFLDKLFTQTKAGVVADNFEPSTPPIFVTIEIEGSTCVLNAGSKVKKFKVEGTYAASLGAQAEEDQTEHELVFTEAGSSVTFEGKPASYTNTVAKLKRTNGKEWYVD